MAQARDKICTLYLILLQECSSIGAIRLMIKTVQNAFSQEIVVYESNIMLYNQVSIIIINDAYKVQVPDR